MGGAIALSSCTSPIMARRSVSSGWRMSAIVRLWKKCRIASRVASSGSLARSSAASSMSSGRMGRPSCCIRRRASRSSTSRLGVSPPKGLPGSTLRAWAVAAPSRSRASSLNWRMTLRTTLELMRSERVKRRWRPSWWPLARPWVSRSTTVEQCVPGRRGSLSEPVNICIQPPVVQVSRSWPTSKSRVASTALVAHRLRSHCAYMLSQVLLPSLAVPDMPSTQTGAGTRPRLSSAAG